MILVVEMSEHTTAPFAYLTKDEVAARLGLSRRGVECLVASKKIPVIRISHRCVRFDWPKVQAAVQRFEVREIGR